ncbi:ADP-ribosyl-[dinitrogen reductase] hydrolase [Rhodoplanes sp. TEM]|uniref:ADP-ribosyl-[dinitrogen reductase] hydrolase n=1 Tax=Rhodoplanes tepidamans TaxID=200616 RepID=A0ABT5JFB3_RHOTP|nr:MULTISPECIES: ADP-ribosyl-[dinitrogen reductase] hydrolase [Rhodoplanes]MDC7788400.1 ADP-ribosyl-[dinitrogen reductase] hydrolase [Rhodoplanes tepidamans]MDC7985899.1 ADP-ribosyl-[dinitrogen reductase] hydrolase [Rhodoplanes sp. TEM]MDQ0357101.1 ADP-ribosyl-[dinitrogen reductase] hydrolase [Rhodoplanes tepidamans]
MQGPTLDERALGAFLGFAVGDALGGTVEFMTRGEIATRYGVHDRIVGGGWLRLAAGQVTDDTEMTLAVGRSLLRKDGLDLQDLCEEFARWLRSGPIDVGNTCRRGIRRFITDGSVQGPFFDGDAGNGATMRILPVALATLGSPAAAAEWCVAQCRTTHHHPLSDAAALALVRMLHRLLAGEPREAVRDIADALVAEHRGFRFDSSPGQSSAYVVDTLRTVLHFYFGTGSFADAVVKTVNQGGDADTTGAIVAMLAGATYGVDAIPAHWLKRLDREVAIEIRNQTPRLLGLAATLRAKAAAPPREPAPPQLPTPLPFRRT